ncbi:MAG TPA: glycine reductase [Methylomirabilota bacterium]|jgi:D-proline reductase (dithiol) PrdB|nr:glycine reductase [Methylomirabilota bacterium]
MTGLSNDFGFAPAHDAPIRYIERTRAYYQALGYGAPYEWAHYAEVPFQPLRKPLAEARVALVTTAAPYQPGKGDQMLPAYNGAAKFFAVYSGGSDGDPDLRIAHVAVDRKHTTGADIGSYFPLRALRAAAGQGRIGALAPRFHGMPTNRSHRVTLEIDVVELLVRCRADEAHAAILVPNCPVCHQTLSLAARHLEANGIATVVMGSAKDIVEQAGVPRFLFSDFPLGNSAGRPNDAESQALTLELALRLLETAPAPRATVQSPLRWSADADWKLDYCNIERMTPDEIAAKRAEFDAAKAEGKRLKEKAGLVHT